MHYESEVTEEMSCVGAGIGGSFSHSSELKVLNHKQLMKSNEKKEWEFEIEKECKIMENTKHGNQCLLRKHEEYGTSYICVAF